ncbi:MAG: hypothetical protein EOR67_16125 [Mesorhizobium sp.]|uniref:hypothetical protein n=1 Tax=Mesorhizobium sp. TaxID=1871066 RepID=UPI000FE4EB9A|nr:hypothetical protein [Mesorhizobium sp.]RWL87724.1 MAG: hypothetical protein EOR67_16125 [Mesorhizobium sp.]
MADLVADIVVEYDSRDPTAGKLPKAARAKLASMREARDDARALQQAIWKKYTDALEKRDQAEIEAKRMQRAFDDGLLFTEEDLKYRSSPGVVQGVRRAPDNRRVNEAKAAVDKAKDELARRQAQNEQRSEAWHALNRLVKRVEDYIDDLPQGTAITAAPPKAGKRLAGDKLKASIETVRSTIATLKADRRDILMAPLPSSHASEFAKAWVAQQAEKARPRLYGLLDGGQVGIEFPVEPAPVNTTVVMDGGTAFGHATGYAGAVGAVALQCWLNPGAMIAALERDIAEIADDERALDPATRAYKDHEVSLQLLEAEREEEALIEMALADGLAVTRRPDADVRAILGLSGDLPEERD